MAQNKKNWWVLIIIVVLALLVFRQTQTSTGSKSFDIIIEKTKIGETKLSPAIPQSKDMAIIPHFAGPNKQEITSANTQSIITVQGGQPMNEIFYMYFDVQATYVQGSPITVRIIDVEAIDDAGNGRSINKNSLLFAWDCILNQQKTLSESTPIALWKPDECAGDKVWVPTTIFETTDTAGQPITQPMLIRFTIEGTYSDNFGPHTSLKQSEIVLDIQNEANMDTWRAEDLVFLSDSFIDQCVAQPTPETAECAGADLVGSACEGTTQTCTCVGDPCTGGLWPGCQYSDYEQNALSLGTTYTGSSEFYTQNWKNICKDGKDNDCDGTTDLTDPDCPQCEIKFRTNADITSQSDDVAQSYVGKWIVMDLNQDGVLESYGAFGNPVYTTDHYCDPNAYTGWGIPGLNTIYGEQVGNRICKHKASGKPTIFFAGGTYLFFDRTDANACNLPEEGYPNCILQGPTAPWSLNNQELCVTY